MTLWGPAVPIPTIRRDERLQVPRLLVQLNRMVAVPGVHHALVRLVLDSGDLVEWRLSGVRLFQTVLVKQWKVYHPPRFS